MKNILVFFGGTTVEHDVSVITGVLTIHSLNEKLFNPVPVYIDRNGEWFTGSDLTQIENFKNLNYKKLTRVTIKCGENKLYAVKGKRLKELFVIYSAINCLHGERGEDGSLSAIMNLSGIPFASPPLAPSAIAMDKDLTKKVLRGIGVNCVNGITVKSESELENITDSLNYPVIIKPCSLGSSIGIEIAENGEEFLSKARSVFRYDKKIIIEDCLKDVTEINCACFRDINGKLIVSECEKPNNSGSMLSFEDKYIKGEREFPAKIDKEISDKIKKITSKIYEELDFFGIIRIDFFVLGKEVFVNEINSVPGSLAYYLFTPSLKEFSKILSGLIFNGVKNFSLEGTLKREVKTPILNISGAKGQKGG